MTTDPRRDALIAAARARLGIPYALPPSPPATTDCSYWVGDVYAAAGLPIPHWLTGVRTAEQIRAAFVKIDFTDALPGDLVWFERTYDATEPSAVGDGHVATHVGISLGAGTRRMMSAVEPVSKESDISSSYWQTRILSVGRHPALETPMPVPDALPLGIDVSSNNGAINWSAVAGGDVEFALCKATGGTWYRNPNFGRDWLAMKSAGLIRGAYHFAFETSGQAFPGDGPEAEADYFLAELARAGGLSAGDLLALDIEDGNGPLGAWALRWLKHVEAAVGFKPLLYSGSWFTVPHGFGSVPELGQYGLWLAAYQAEMPEAPAPWDFVSFWQFTDALSVPGISGNVDGNRWNGSAERIKLMGKPDDVNPPVHPPETWQDGLKAILERDENGAALRDSIRAWLATVSP